MAKVFCIDVSRCSGCYNCQFACKDEHCNNEWMPYARKQPIVGQFWLKVQEHVQGTRPKVKIHYMPTLCNHCEDPACLKAAKKLAGCPADDDVNVYADGKPGGNPGAAAGGMTGGNPGAVSANEAGCGNGGSAAAGGMTGGKSGGNPDAVSVNEAGCGNGGSAAAVYKREDGLVIIDPEKAVGMKELVDACPYGAIYWNEDLNLPQKCTGCAHLLAVGKTPRCVDVCHTGAIRFGEESEFADFIEGATVLNPQFGTGPKVYYRNIPGRFIGGTVYDPVEEVVIRNARCHLSMGAKTWDVFTDDFGDFWFFDLPHGRFDLSIEAKGFARKYFENINTANDSVNLDDIPLERAE